MSEPITHVFVSAKSDSADTTLVSANEWNDGHTFLGGINGQILIYDNTQPNNMRFTDGPTFYTGSVTSGAVASPFTTATIVTVSCNTQSIYQINPDFLCTTSGGASYNANVNLNGVAILNLFTIASGAQFTYPFGGLIAAGTSTFTVTFTASAGTFTSTAATLRVLTFGR